MKKIGFTLAEVLITLGIIGVVAALTTPSLVMNSKNEANAAKLAVVVNSLENAFTTAIATEGVSDLYHTRMWQFVDDYDTKNKTGGLNANSEEAKLAGFMGELGRYLITNGYRKVGSKDFYAKSKAKTYKMSINGGKGVETEAGDAGDGKSFPIIMKNGAVVFFRGFGKGTFDYDEEAIRLAGGSLFDNPADVMIDVNGTSEPNIIGRDIFYFYVGQNGILYPLGGHDIAILDTNGKNVDYSKLNTWDNTKSGNQWAYTCLDGNIQNGGVGCAARLIEENYKMNY